MNNLQVGLKGHSELIVGTNDTAMRVGSGKMFVLATPVMLGLMEEAALNAVEHLLPDGYRSLGTKVDISHIAATPIRMKVTADAELVQIDGRKLTFEVTAQDEIERIGGGIHERVVVSASGFENRIAAKIRD